MRKIYPMNKLRRLSREAPVQVNRLFALDCFLFARDYAKELLEDYDLNSVESEALSVCRALTLQPDQTACSGLPTGSDLNYYRVRVQHDLLSRLSFLKKTDLPRPRLNIPARPVPIDWMFFVRQKLERRRQMDTLLARVAYYCLSKESADAAYLCYDELAKLGMVRASWPIQQYMRRYREIQTASRSALISLLRDRQSSLTALHQFTTDLESTLFS
jgi:hypothetical protein